MLVCVSMRRLWFPLLIALLLAACSGAPQKVSRGPASSTDGAYPTSPPGLPNFVDHSVGREEISIQAMSLVGIPYRWGGNTPDSGFDCSGLVRYVVERAASVNLPRTTADMSGRGESIEPDEIATGDLIFFNTTGRPHSHVGIYVGKLRFVNAPSTGGTVRLDYLTNPYWAKRFDGIRRVAAPARNPAPFDTPAWQASTEPDKAPSVTQPHISQAAPVAATTVATSSPLPARMATVSPWTSSGTGSTSTAISATAQPAAASTDPFEPPPPGLSAAQTQARAAGAIAPSVMPAPRAQEDSGALASTQAPVEVAPKVSTEHTAVANAPDAIDAAADAFEPPPPAAVAARQAQQAQQSGAAGEVQIMRASTVSRPVAAPTHTNDDPIARFANGSF
jgi:hypothetical protein